MNAMPRLSALAAATALWFFAGCSSPSGRVMSDTEDDLVGDRRAGAATYDRLIEGAVNKLLDRFTGGLTRSSTAKVAFGGVDNKSAEELGEWRDQITQIIDTKVNKFVGFETVSMRYVEAALRETNLRIDDLFIPKNRRAFLAVLERNDNPAQALLFATLTRGTTQSGDLTQANYLLTMEMVDSEGGNNIKETQELRKEYSR